jgi:PAS domain S-box-containing protein
MANEDVQKTLAELSRDLQESKARLEEAQRVAHVGHWEWDLETDIVVWSDETYRIFGLSPQERPMDLATVRAMVHPEDRESLYQGVDEDLVAGVRPDAEFRIVRPNGEVRTVHSVTPKRWSAMPGDAKRNASERPYKLFGTVQDITDRKRAEEALKQSQFYLSEGQRLAHMGSWASNDLGIRWSDDLGIYWSDEVYKIYGLDPQNGAPNLKQYLATIHPDDRASMAETIRVMHERRCGCDVTKRIVRPDGEVRYVRCVGVPVFEGGVFKAFHGTTMDVTEHELLTKELRRERAYLTEAQSLTHTGSWACNLLTREIFHSSDENARLYGFDPSQGAIPFDRFYNAILAEDEVALRTKLENAIREGADYDLGLRPGRRNSGMSEPQMHISKEGDRYLRTLMVQGAHYILGPFGQDSDLRRWGLQLAERGGKNAKKRAVVAVARKLTVLLHKLWVSGEVYEPLRNNPKVVSAVA